MKIGQFLFEKSRMQPTTVTYYRRHLRRLAGWLHTEQIELDDLTCSQFQTYLATKPWGNSMQRGSLYSLRSYLRWNKNLQHPIMLKDKFIAKLEPKNKKFLSPQDLGLLLAACDTCQSGMPERNRSLLTLLYDSLIRVSELTDIRLDDCRRDDNGDLTGVFKVRTKAKPGSGERHYEFKEINPNGTLAALNAWLAVRDKFARPGDPYLFVSQVQTTRENGDYLSGGTKMSVHTVRALLNRLHKKSGVKTNCHAFRRGSATNEKRKGRDLFDIMDSGGWTSMTVLRGYVEETSAEDRQALRFAA